MLHNLLVLDSKFYFNVKIISMCTKKIDIFIAYFLSFFLFYKKWWRLGKYLDFVHVYVSSTL